MVAVAVVMAVVQVHLEEQEVEEEAEGQVDRQLQVKETLEPLAYLTAKITGLAAVVVARVALARHHPQRLLDLVAQDVKFPGFH